MPENIIHSFTLTKKEKRKKSMYDVVPIILIISRSKEIPLDELKNYKTTNAICVQNKRIDILKFQILWANNI